MIFESRLVPGAVVRSFSPVSQLLLQRKCSCGGSAPGGGECKECKAKKKRLQRRALGHESSGDLAPGTRAVVQEALRSSAEPLDHGIRAFMEPRFGHDFGAVRIHRGPEADAAAQAVNAAAFTIGRDIVIANPFYEPQSPMGRHLLAHELAHTIQQGNSDAGQTTSFEIADNSSSAEIEADVVATRLTNDRTSVAGALSHRAPTLARIDCSTLPTKKSCKPYSCGYGGSGVCYWNGKACVCMGAIKPSTQRVLEVLLIIGISLTLLITIIAALADPEPATKLGLAGLSAAQIALLLELLGYEKRTASTSEGTAILGGDATAVHPENVA